MELQGLGIMVDEPAEEAPAVPVEGGGASTPAAAPNSFSDEERRSMQRCLDSLVHRPDSCSDEHRCEMQCSRSCNLVHACQCSQTDCLISDCIRVKRVIQHVRACPDHSKCGICKQTPAICRYHSEHCTQASCDVLRCGQLKEKRRNQAMKNRSGPYMPLNHRNHSSSATGVGIGAGGRKLVGTQTQSMGSMGSISSSSSGTPWPHCGAMSTSASGNLSAVDPMAAPVLMAGKRPHSPTLHEWSLGNLAAQKKSNAASQAHLLPQQQMQEQHQHQQQQQMHNRQQQHDPASGLSGLGHAGGNAPRVAAMRSVLQSLGFHVLNAYADIHRAIQMSKQELAQRQQHGLAQQQQQQQQQLQQEQHLQHQQQQHHQQQLAQRNSLMAAGGGTPSATPLPDLAAAHHPLLQAGGGGGTMPFQSMHGSDLLMDGSPSQLGASPYSHGQSKNSLMAQDMMDMGAASQLPPDPLLSSSQLGGLDLGAASDFDPTLPSVNATLQDRLSNHASAL